MNEMKILTGYLDKLFFSVRISISIFQNYTFLLARRMKLNLIPHSIDFAEVLHQLKVDSSTGLSSEEAASRLAQYGENKLDEAKKITVFQRFISQFKDVMIIILLIAAAVSFVVSSGIYLVKGK